MSTETFARHTEIDAPVADVFRWHELPGAFERLTPPWEKVEVLARTGGLENGSRATLRLRVGPFRVPWVLEHRDFERGRQFRDVQISGPFARWEHTHRFDEDGRVCDMQDRIEYALPCGPLGPVVCELFVKSELERLFIYRHRTIKHDMARHRAFTSPPLRILVTGSSGLIGSSLIPFLTTGGHSVVRLVRAPPAGATEGETVLWDPVAGRLDASALEGFDAVIHLAGEGLMGFRWTEAKKARIRDSRINGTRLLCEALASLKKPPRVLLSASAVGFYGHRGSEILHEESEPGTGFLAGLCRAWELATKPAADRGIRVVHLRTGVALSPAGGALGAMIVPFLLGLGGPIGDGWQFMSWIAIDDVVGAIHHALMTDTLAGPVNVVGPYVAANRDFARTLGAVVERPAFLRLPAFVARVAMGEVADELLLASTRVEPRKLIDSGFIFHYPELEGALRHVLGRA
jgi:uncharacterized protein